MLGDHLGYELGMVREIGVHNDHEVAGAELKAVNVGRTEAELAGASFEEDVGRVGFCELFCDGLRAVGGAIVNDYELPVELPICARVRMVAPGKLGGGGWA